MKKLTAVFSAMLLSAATLTACGTVDVNDVNDRRIYDVNDYNDRNVFDVSDNDFDALDPRPYNVDRNIYNRVGDSPFLNDPEADGNQNIFGPDRDDVMFNDEGITQRYRMNR